MTTWDSTKTLQLAASRLPWWCLLAFNRGYIRKGLNTCQHMHHISRFTKPRLWRVHWLWRTSTFCMLTNTQSTVQGITVRTAPPNKDVKHTKHRKESEATFDLRRPMTTKHSKARSSSSTHDCHHSEPYVRTFPRAALGPHHFCVPTVTCLHKRYEYWSKLAWENSVASIWGGMVFSSTSSFNQPAATV